MAWQQVSKYIYLTQMRVSFWLIISLDFFITTKALNHGKDVYNWQCSADSAPL